MRLVGTRGFHQEHGVCVLHSWIKDRKTCTMASGAFSRAGMLGFSDSEGHVEPGVSVRPCLKTYKIQTEIHCESLFCLVVEEIMDDKEKQSEESRAVRVGQKQTVTPTLAEWEEHERSHIPCRSWCRHCVAARASNAAHRGRKFTRSVEDDKEMKQVSNDCFVRPLGNGISNDPCFERLRYSKSGAVDRSSS